MHMPMLMPMLLPLLIAALASPLPPGATATCQRWCGGVEIPYPFGIGRGCYLETGDGDRAFELACTGAGDGDGGAVRRRPTTAVDGFEVLGVDVRRGKLRVRSRVNSWCYNATTRSMGAPATWSYGPAALRVSDSDNMLTVVGCNASAYIDTMMMSGGGNGYTVGCHAVCAAGARSLADGSCNGTGGCCQTHIPRGVRSFGVSFIGVYNISGAVAELNPCSYAVVVEAAAFEFRTTYVTTRELGSGGAGGRAPAVVLDWAVGNRTCQEARKNKTAYACVSEHSECFDSGNGPGYICNCSKGFQGNPYVRDGCQDIDECMDRAMYPCHLHATCMNLPGSYNCRCPAGRRFINAEVGCKIDEFLLGAIGTSIGVVVVAVVLSCTYAFQEKKRLAAIKRRYFKQHGGLLLFEEMKSRQGLSFTLFTKEELEEATNMFDERHVLGKGGNGTVYRGDLRDGRAVAIKRCRLADDERQRREFGKEMLILSQVNHRNIVKLYGCCLEVEVPMLVYQFIPNGTLYQLIHGRDADRAPPPPPFAVRLKIAREAAEALAYLHSTASPPIIHGDVKSANILIDDGHTARVSDFGASALAPADAAHLVQLVQGTDVYSFGVVLLELLTRRKALALAAPEAEERSLAACFLAATRDGRLDELVDARIKGEVGDEALGTVARLARRCLEMSGETRPSMREVAEELDRIQKLCPPRIRVLNRVHALEESVRAVRNSGSWSLR
ncbi:hypothetical protein ACP4OV_021913 [Aristida adscensionis]